MACITFCLLLSVLLCSHGEHGRTGLVSFSTFCTSQISVKRLVSMMTCHISSGMLKSARILTQVFAAPLENVVTAMTDAVCTNKIG